MNNSTSKEDKKLADLFIKGFREGLSKKGEVPSVVETDIADGKDFTSPPTQNSKK
jgi:hypothetical protein